MTMTPSTLDLTGNTNSASTHSQAPLLSVSDYTTWLALSPLNVTVQRSTPTRARRIFVSRSTFSPIIGADDDNGGRLLIPGSRAQGNVSLSFSPHPPRIFQYIYVEPLLVDYRILRYTHLASVTSPPHKHCLQAEELGKKLDMKTD
ncbi:hypothetical protein D9757_011501 [Collybiopsis confluens]|uniref:Uncharacterized protein n=1 Tax=Collybiopsis confluens TaxID=2823264 RepID=A0A8H5GVN2_9AGAR|nr:hypothetical protein D9757_011501 [Collybiopsis confluens]